MNWQIMFIHSRLQTPHTETECCLTQSCFLVKHFLLVKDQQLNYYT